MVKNYVETDMCEEKMKPVIDLKEKLDNVCENHIPHLNNDVSQIKSDILWIKKTIYWIGGIMTAGFVTLLTTQLGK